ncbi:MAG: tetratricopeptide repeat protein [Armatimonadota bacterium]
MRSERRFRVHLITFAAMVCVALLVAPPLRARRGGKKSAAALAAGSHLMQAELRRFSNLRRSADAAFRRGRMAEAEDLYREMLAIDRESPYAQRRIGDCLVNQERYEQAIAAYEKLAGMPPSGADNEEHTAAAPTLIELARQLRDRAAPLRTAISDEEKLAFSNQAMREADIHAELHDYGAALRAAAYAESVGREVGAPISGEDYNDLVVEALRYHMDAENYAAAGALFEVADYLGIHSRERAELETEFAAATKGEVRKIQAAAAPYLTALDQEVQERKAEDAKRDAQRRKSRVSKITSAFTGLLSELVPLVGARRVHVAAATATPAEKPGKYVHLANRRVDYGKIVKLKPQDQVLYSIAPLTFYQTPGEWKAWAALNGYETHQPALPKQDSKGPFIVARERDQRGLGWYYFLLDDPSDKKAQQLGRYATATDAEKALEYHIANDHNAMTGTFSHD